MGSLVQNTPILYRHRSAGRGRDIRTLCRNFIKSRLTPELHTGEVADLFGVGEIDDRSSSSQRRKICAAIANTNGRDTPRRTENGKRRWSRAVHASAVASWQNHANRQERRAAELIISCAWFAHSKSPRNKR